MSQRISGFERKPLDLYVTTHWCTRALAPHLPKNISGVWECAAGTGIMADALREAGFWVSATDIADGVDFLEATDRPAESINAIITNAPFKLGTEFVEKALRLMEPVNGTVAMLFRTDFDHAQSRAHLFRDCPAFAKKVVLTRRVVWFPPKPGEKKMGPSVNHAWFVWSWRHEGPPTIGYGP